MAGGERDGESGTVRTERTGWSEIALPGTSMSTTTTVRSDLSCVAATACVWLCRRQCHNVVRTPAGAPAQRHALCSTPFLTSLYAHVARGPSQQARLSGLCGQRPEPRFPDSATEKAPQTRVQKRSEGRALSDGRGWRTEEYTCSGWAVSSTALQDLQAFEKVLYCFCPISMWSCV